MVTDADKRRAALRRFMEMHNLKRGSLAKQAAISPNIIYNFLNGKSSYLSQPTLEKIARRYGVAITAITGERGFGTIAHTGPVHAREPSASLEAPLSAGALATLPTTLRVEGEIKSGGVWSESILLDYEPEEYASFALPALYAAKAFAVKLTGPAMNALIPDGAVLACIAIRDYAQRLVAGDIVIVVRQNRPGLFETVARQYGVEGGQHYLAPRSTDPRYRERLMLESPLDDPAATGHQDFFIHAVVLGYAASLPAAKR